MSVQISNDRLEAIASDYHEQFVQEMARELIKLRHENFTLRVEWRRAVSRMESMADTADNAGRVVRGALERSMADYKVITGKDHYDL